LILKNQFFIWCAQNISARRNERNKTAIDDREEQQATRKQKKKKLFYFCFFIASGHIKVVCMRDIREKKKNSEQG